jgi:hypothetical protein
MIYFHETTEKVELLSIVLLLDLLSKGEVVGVGCAVDGVCILLVTLREDPSCYPHPTRTPENYVLGTPGATLTP